MQLPNTQALNSKSFKSVHAVLARGDAALPDVYKWIAQNSPEHPLFVYYDDATESLQYILWRDVDKGFNRAAHYLTRFHNGWPGDRPVIAILASSGTQPSEWLQTSHNLIDETINIRQCYVLHYGNRSHPCRIHTIPSFPTKWSRCGRPPPACDQDSCPLH